MSDLKQELIELGTLGVQDHEAVVVELEATLAAVRDLDYQRAVPLAREALQRLARLKKTQRKALNVLAILQSPWR